jgi:plastocyanin
VPGSVRRRGIRSTDQPEVPTVKRLLATLALATVALAAAACSSTTATGGTAAPAAPADPNAPAITANNLRFGESTVAVPAGKAFQLTFTNQESAPHNVAIYSDASATTNLFRGEIFSSGSKVQEVPALPAGSYFFRCDVHPDMQGTITAQ